MAPSQSARYMIGRQSRNTEEYSPTRSFPALRSALKGNDCIEDFQGRASMVMPAVAALYHEA